MLSVWCIVIKFDIEMIVLNLKMYDSVTTYLMRLHLLPVRQRIIYKLNLNGGPLTMFSPCFP